MQNTHQRLQSDPVAEEVVQRPTAADSVKSFVSGGFGGVCAVLVGKSPFPALAISTSR